MIRAGWHIAALGLLLALLGGCARTAAPPTSAARLSGALSVSAPASASVGSAVSVSVSADAAPDGTPVLLNAIGSYGPHLYRGSFSGGKAVFKLPDSVTQAAGTLTLLAVSGDARGQASMQVSAGPPVEPITPLVGGRSIIADTKHWSMAVIVPFDAFGNPVADGTPAEFRILHPGDQLEVQRTSVKNLLAWVRINSRTRAGRTQITASAGDAHGPIATLEQVASWPEEFTLSATPPSLPADGFQLMTLRTSVIKDRFGNTMPDGTLISFVVDTPESAPRTIPAYTIDGAAEATLQAPSRPETLTAYATIYGVESAPLQLTFTDGPAVGGFPLIARVDSKNRTLILEAGPMLGPLGEHIPDGTEVLFHLIDAAGQDHWVSALSDQGRARTEIRLIDLPLGTYSAEAQAGSGSGATRFIVQ